MKQSIKIFLTIILCFVSLQYATAQNKRGLWVWNTLPVIGSTNETNILINQCKTDNITDIYLYSYGKLSGGNIPLVQSFISKARCNNINVWAIDGYRAYFDDWNGPAQYYTFINSVVNYNAISTADQRFIGIQGDNEPQDGQGQPRNSFHNGIASSALNTLGGGVWQATAALDREYLMRSFLTITEQAYNTCKLNNLLYGQAMGFWLDDYEGEPIYCTYNGVNKRVIEHLMDYLDDYCVMSYSTNPANVINFVQGELTYAATLPVSTRPKVWAGLETHCGIGSGISYCDTPPKNTKAAVYTDMNSIVTALSSFAAFNGINIHDWEDGWKDLPAVSSNTTDPGCSSLPVDLISFAGSYDQANNRSVLKWITASEKNNSHFSIERSDNGIDFSPIGRMKGMGSTNSM